MATAEIARQTGPAPATPRKKLVEVVGLKKYFPIRGGLFGRVKGNVKAVDDVSFEIDDGETLGMVGESGCGKTTVGRSILRLIEPSAGTVFFGDREITAMGQSELRRARRQMQIIFQDPYSSLNPRMTVEGIVGEALTVHGIAKGHDRRRMVEQLLVKVGLSARHIGRYPHEFSGGQRQRIGIARALALSPKFIVCDEAVSALDVSIQAQILNLLMDLQQDLGLSYLFIAHDLSVVEHISDRVAVMYLGKMAEVAPAGTIYEHPLHPYTRALLSAIPIPDPLNKRPRIKLEGDVPSPVNPPPGCNFHTRCVYAEERCKRDLPVLRDVGAGHRVACHLVDVALGELVKDGKIVPAVPVRRLNIALSVPAGALTAAQTPAAAQALAAQAPAATPLTAAADSAAASGAPSATDPALEPKPPLS